MKVYEEGRIRFVFMLVEDFWAYMLSIQRLNRLAYWFNMAMFLFVIDGIEFDRDENSEGLGKDY
ncbi:hypothetical protein [Bacillus sp. T17B1]|uniref:hypothetical protein n=1 Tax=Bacillus sp. T17B1 TaxID=2918911 RepID=UPI0024E0B3B1